MINPFRRKSYELEYLHRTGLDIIRFTCKSSNINDLFNQHVEILDKFMQEQERHKTMLSEKQKEQLK